VRPVVTGGSSTKRGTRRACRKAGLPVLDEHHAADSGSALTLAFDAVRAGGKLQHRGVLPGAQTGQEHHLAARKFERVMVVVRVVEVDLLEARDFLPQLLVGEEAERVLAFDIAVEHELRPREETDRDVRLFHRRKPARDGVGKL
jgi:hypothetical protein